MRLRHSILLFTVTLCLLAPLAGCSSWNEVTGPTVEDLDRSISAFRKQLLFGRYANAKTLIYPSRKSAFTRFTFEIEDRLRVTEFEAQDLEIVDLPEEEAVDPSDPREARVLVRIEYTLRPNMEVQKQLLDMVWLPVSGGWMLEFPEEGWKL